MFQSHMEEQRKQTEALVKAITQGNHTEEQRKQTEALFKAIMQGMERSVTKVVFRYYNYITNWELNHPYGTFSKFPEQAKEK